MAVAAAGCGGGGDSVPAGEQAKAVAAAKKVFQEENLGPAELAQGPCIAETLPGLGDWVVDVAHDPRRAVDDKPQNQCERFRAGDAAHFVELDPQGKLIRAQ